MYKTPIEKLMDGIQLVIIRKKRKMTMDIENNKYKSIFRLVGHCAYTIECSEGFFENVFVVVFLWSTVPQIHEKKHLFFEEKAKHRKFREILLFQSHSKANLKEIGQKKSHSVPSTNLPMWRERN